ncbi:MAG TPA: hypothetical protein VFW52_03795 [Candidatus Saccharimonadales bacterium]|nr:hypothetical protein [Candidatus Saccharimonadales bacterium]
MAGFEFENLWEQEPLTEESRQRIYQALYIILEREGQEENELFLTATVPIDDPKLTAGPPHSSPAIRITRPIDGPKPNWNYDYEVTYGFQDPNHVLHLEFLTGANPIAHGLRTEPLNILKGEETPMIEAGWPTREFYESDAQKLLEDLQEILDKTESGE